MKHYEAYEFARSHGCLEAAWNQCPRADWMLWMWDSACNREMMQRAHDADLRLFACWCARACLQEFTVPAGIEAAVATAEAFAHGDLSDNELERTYQEASALAATSQTRLPKTSPELAALLCCVQTTHASAMQAARQTSQCHILCVRTFAAKMGAARVKWPGELDEFITLNAEVLEAVEGAGLSGQAEALRHIVGNPFAGRVALKRWPRNDIGVPLTPDIADVECSGELRKLPLSEAQRQRARQPDPQRTEAVLSALLQKFSALKRESGEAAAYRYFMGCWDAILQAEDLDPVEDGPYMDAYETARQMLFRRVLAREAGLM